jgi:DtxR family Mn-dependent transcriptional regulator
VPRRQADGLLPDRAARARGSRLTGTAEEGYYLGEPKIMGEALSESIQDYLKHIHALCGRGRAASTTALAARLGVSPASVTGMVQRLAALEPPLVVYRKHRGVSLTPAGERAALEVIRHHRLLEVYLVRTLGYSWDAVHEEACRLEHAISETLEQRIAKSLGDPRRDPHGAPIPSAELVLEIDSDILLSSLSEGVRAVVSRVMCHEARCLRRLEAQGLVPGAEVAVLAQSSSGRVTVSIDGSPPAVLRPSVSGRVLVQSVKGSAA